MVTAKKWVKFTYHKRKNKELGMVLKRYGLSSVSSKIMACGEYIQVIECENCGTKHWGGFYRCNNRFCYLCQYALGLKKMIKIIEKIRKDGYYEHWIFTVKSKEKLEEGYNLLSYAFKKLGKTKYWKNRVKGYYASIEITYNPKKGWHPHIHCIVELDGMSRDYETISEIWQGYGGGYVSLVRLRDVSAIVEVCKYIVKLQDIEKMGKQQVQELVEFIKSKKQNRCGGTLKVKLNEDFDIGDEVDKLEGIICVRCGMDSMSLRKVLTNSIRSYDVVYDVSRNDFEECVKDDEVYGNKDNCGCRCMEEREGVCDEAEEECEQGSCGGGFKDVVGSATKN